MNRAGLAGRFFLCKPATLQAGMGIFQQRPTIGTQFRMPFLFPAIKPYHQFHDTFLPFYTRFLHNDSDRFRDRTIPQSPLLFPFPDSERKGIRCESVFRCPPNSAACLKRHSGPRPAVPRGRSSVGFRSGKIPTFQAIVTDRVSASSTSMHTVMASSGSSGSIFSGHSTRQRFPLKKYSSYPKSYASSIRFIR